MLVFKTLKGGKAADCEEIRPEMLKALILEGGLWVTRMGQMPWYSGGAAKDW